jgi:hypothetical protein
LRGRDFIEFLVFIDVLLAFIYKGLAAKVDLVSWSLPGIGLPFSLRYEMFECIDGLLFSFTECGQKPLGL